MTQTCFIATRLAGLNEIIAAAKSGAYGHGSRYTEMKQCYESLCKVDIRQAKLKPVKGPVSLTFIWMEPNQKRDKDNITAGQKFVIDALVSAQILANDGWKQIASITHEWCVVDKRPGVQVVLREEPA